MARSTRSAPSGPRSFPARAAGTAALLTLLSVLVGACGGEGLALGDAGSIIVASDPALWEGVEDTLRTVLEPTVLTVRDERTFDVTFQDPSSTRWPDMRRFKQVLLMGRPDEPWLADLISGADAAPPPSVVRLDDVWARGQEVLVVLVPEENPETAVASLLGDLHEHYDRNFRRFARDRMFVTGADSALADSLQATAGFYLVVPKVYDWRQEDDVFIFRNDNPDPSELIREVAVTWKSPIPPDMQPEGLLAWREEVADAHYGTPQVVDLSLVQAGATKHNGRDAYQIQAIWGNPPESMWPAAGPFILRAVVCPGQNRMYLLDAWLYAPAKDKYEYMLQLETILDSFRCDGRGSTAGG